MADLGLGGLVAATSLAVPLLEVALALSAIEYAVVALVIGRRAHGRRLDHLAQQRGWRVARTDREGALRRLAPADLPRRPRRRRVRAVVQGDSTQGPFTLFLYRGGRRRRRDSRYTALCAMRAPFAAPSLFVRARVDRDTPDPADGSVAFHDRFDVASPDASFARAVLRDDVRALLEAHPDLSWEWTGDTIVVATHAAPSAERLQELVHAADKFRALAPLAGTGVRDGTPGSSGPVVAV